MRKILIFFLILASFSCATLDNHAKENQSIEKGSAFDESEKASSVAYPDNNVIRANSEKAEKLEENGNSQKEELNSQVLQNSKEEKVVANLSDANNTPNTTEVKEAKKEEKKEEKTDAKRQETPNQEKPNKEELEQNRKTEPSATTEKEKNAEKVKSLIADEMALEDSSDLFTNSIKIEPKKEEKKAEKVLPFLEILKDIEELLSFFKKSMPSVATATKQHVEKIEKDVKPEKSSLEQTEKEKEETEPLESVAKKDEDVVADSLPAEDNSSSDGLKDELNEETSSVSPNEDALFDGFNGDAEPLHFDDEDSQFSFNDEGEAFNFDDEVQPFNFDDENKTVTKQNEDNKGQLSTIVDEEDKVNISRYTNIIKGQNIDFSYPGEGWVYLGEETSQKGLSYVKRKMEDGKTFFTFTAENEGNYVLNFSYFDVFSGDFIVDAVSVKVMPNNDGVQKDSLVLEYQGKNGKKPVETQPKKTPNEVNVDADKVAIKAEELEKKDDGKTQQSSGVASAKNAGTLKPTTSGNLGNNAETSGYKEPEVFVNVASISPENAKNTVSTEDVKKIIDEASEAISNGNAKVALKRLDDYFAVASTNMDEAYFLRGKAYELNTDQKNIKMALSAYKFLTKTFPNSPFWNEADARIRYIEKFFVKIK